MHVISMRSATPVAFFLLSITFITSSRLARAQSSPPGQATKQMRAKVAQKNQVIASPVPTNPASQKNVGNGEQSDHLNLPMDQPPAAATVNPPPPQPQEAAVPGISQSAVLPGFSVAPGFVALSTAVSISSPTTGAIIFYTTDGTTPNQTSSQFDPNTPVVIDASKTVKAVTVAAGYLTSAVSSASYIIGTPTNASLPQVIAPVFSRAQGSTYSGATVVLSSQTPNAVIYYTTDKHQPDLSSSQFDPTKPITLNSDTTVNAMAVAAGNATSSVSTAKYTIVKNLTCIKETAGYNFRHWAPLFSKDCTNDAIQDYFNVAGAATVANKVQYLYNAKQSTNQVNADLFTATFRPGFQAILAGTATQGASQPAANGTASGSGIATNPTLTDSADAAVAKLEQGGDFNLRFPVPVWFYAKTTNTGSLTFLPNVGFTVNGLTGQNTITQSTEYNWSVPIEGYFETGSVETGSDGKSSAVIYVDLKGAAEGVSKDFATAVGLTSGRYFFLGQASAGIEFMNSVRVGLQYFIGPSQLYTVPSATGGTPTQVKSSLGGLHLVVSFSPTTK